MFPCVCVDSINKIVICIASAQYCKDSQLLLIVSATYDELQKLSTLECLGFVFVQSKLISLKLEERENYSVYGNAFVCGFLSQRCLIPILQRGESVNLQLFSPIAWQHAPKGEAGVPLCAL